MNSLGLVLTVAPKPFHLSDHRNQPAERAGEKTTAKINMSNIIILKKAPAITPRGKHRGRFVEAKQAIGEDKFGVEHNNLIVSVELEDKDKSGKPYRIEKQYNLLGRGVSAFATDFKSWNRRAMTEEEIEGFNPDDLIKDKQVTVEIAHRGGGQNKVAYIKEFLPAELDEVAAQ